MEVPLMRRHLLTYEYVTENLLERRAPHREAHLELIEAWMADGRILLAGVLGDPPHGAAIAFSVEAPEEVEPFMAADPYVAAGLVRSWRIEPWSTVFD